MSTHKAEVVYIDKYHSIDGADRIVRVDVWGYPCVVSLEQYRSNANRLWCYIPPDTLVPTYRDEFSFLAKPGKSFERIKTRRYKGQQSFGLLIPAPSGSSAGQDLFSALELKHYEPPVKGESYTPPTSRLEKIARTIFRRSIKFGERPPNIYVPYYDIENLRRFPDLYNGQLVYITEKIHGTNVAYCHSSRGILHRLLRPKREQNLRIRSRTVWKKPEEAGWWQTAVTQNIKDFCRNNPNTVLFGEIYGPQVQGGFDYGVTKPTFVAFDVYNHKDKTFFDMFDMVDLCGEFDIPTVPLLWYGAYDFNKACELAEGKSTLGGTHVKEGVVVTPTQSIQHHIRNLKCVGASYYEKAES